MQGLGGLGEVLSFVNLGEALTGFSAEEWRDLIYIFKRSLWLLSGEWIEVPQEWRRDRQVLSPCG